MTPIDATSIFATLVGLICNWKQERGSVSGEKFQDFLIWLTNHNFKELRAQILNSEDIQRELHTLLKQDAALVSEKLDIICNGISALSGRIDLIAPLARALRSSSESLSDQAAEILKIFDQTNSEKMVAMLGHPTPTLLYLPTQQSISVAHPRFLNDDLESLVTFGFVRVSDHSGDGDPIFTITRPGSSFAQQLPPVELGPIE